MRLSAEQFASACTQAPYIYERVQGRLVVMSPAGPEHRAMSRPFRRELGVFWQTHPTEVDEVDVEGWLATSSDQERDYITKRRGYHAVGVKEYVIVDRFKQAILILTHCGSNDYAERWLHSGEYTTPLLPGLKVSLAEVFR